MEPRGRIEARCLSALPDKVYCCLQNECSATDQASSDETFIRIQILNLTPMLVFRANFFKKVGKQPFHHQCSRSPCHPRRHRLGGSANAHAQEQEVEGTLRAATCYGRPVWGGNGSQLECSQDRGKMAVSEEEEVVVAFMWDPCLSFDLFIDCVVMQMQRQRKTT